MKLSYVGAIIGLLISVAWIAFGFWKMLIIAIAIVIGVSLGAWLDLQGITFKNLLVKLLNKLTN
ncbi:hypothetical protein FC19_GL000682 [Liquorilactobacillus aquaticus DSM 21051]|uniref:Small integral membrane protein n=1 Tax=Liquorilactobacillus aquaticus DSM 21051 TaxID=1423725 RepID=A0A0R2D6Y2_9LACO|nr:DUF2273 domain-containing protein [Liquorilactobacillus aquaticus]KRM96393.1 hypothetical protein FC19_GL000682 [Liquorilactobacillus aquaticus DSM 21051]